MTGLGPTLERLARLQARKPPFQLERSSDRLREIADFGSNPGALGACFYLPASLAENPPLVVVLHGCTQTAQAYDHGAGWSRLADEMGFALLLPQQQRANNPNLCFNWFSPVDARRGSGEVLSIRQMIAAMVAAHGIDERRIFITGLSAGAAMASNMVAAYPEVFAAGALIAGLPFGAASSVNEAFARMQGGGYPSDLRLAEAVRGASDHRGPWPRISVWQGTADSTVAPSNAERILAQWRIVHDLVDTQPEREVIDGSSRRTWRGAKGERILEAYDIPGMGHGTPLDTRGASGCGASGPFMIEAGISSTRHIADFWGLTTPCTRFSADTAAKSPEAQAASSRPARVLEPVAIASTQSPRGVGAVIEDALRKAGLMR